MWIKRDAKKFVGFLGKPVIAQFSNGARLTGVVQEVTEIVMNVGGFKFKLSRPTVLRELTAEEVALLEEVFPPVEAAPLRAAVLTPPPRSPRFRGVKKS